MSNFQVYKKTLSFSFLEFLSDLFALIVFVGSCILGFVIMNKSTDMALIGLAVGLVIGIILSVLINIFIKNRIKAAQIAMMTIGVVEGKLPEKTVNEGFNQVKGRFGKITLFFTITSLIKSVFRQIGRSLNKLGTAVGGNVGNGITSAIDSAIQVLIGYLCDCCLGWILYCKDENSFKAGCEGAVIFFKHGKTLIRNIGRIFGMGLLSLVVVGGAFFGIAYLIFTQFPQIFESLSKEILEMSTREALDIPQALTDPKILMLIIAGVLGVILWSMIHSVLIRPFILVGVLRNFMAAGLKEKPTEADFAELEKLSPRFTKMKNRANA